MLESLLAVLDLSPTTKECIDSLKKLIIEENKKENEHLGSYNLYDTYCKQSVEKNLWIFFNLGYDCCPA